MSSSSLNSSSLVHVPFSSLPHPAFSFAASLSPPTPIPSFSTYLNGPFTCSPSSLSPSPSPVSFSSSAKSQQQQFQHSEAERVIEAWSKTFQPHFAAFVLFCNGTGVVFLKKNLTRLTSSSPSLSSENREKGVLCERAMGLLQHTGIILAFSFSPLLFSSHLLSLLASSLPVSFLLFH
jgi:hypothetical protein